MSVCVREDDATQRAILTACATRICIVAGVLPATTSTPAAGADVEFGVGVVLLVSGGASSLAPLESHNANAPKRAQAAGTQS